MWKKLIAGLLCTAFIFHFAITLIYNTPSNPIKAKYNKQLSAYMDPIFTQNWRLFAPAPVTTNSKFFVKAKIKSDNDTTTTGWIDIVDYMIKENQENRFTPYNRLLRIPRGAFALRQESDDTMQEVIKKINNGKLDKEEYKHLVENERSKNAEKISNNLLNRYAEAHLKSAYPNKDIIEFKVLLVESNPIPFSKKEEKNPNNEKRYIELDWAKPQNVISMF
ncbi:DUF5819 family protein [Bacillus hominis]|uniref:DUF5819 family protein n=1 Tax=Bacillus hominis TaxID=2817478 RepID=A0ABT7RG41_9BACI|nr:MULTISPECIES: DUF5819 family protein [Bacillus cereus group]HDR7325976.1 hypothetical protein [Bacillus toyonensis]MCC2544592.1 DUF5819 family protein [Bacillus thuringiensis]MDF9547765.1 DUF5819 family protein [Bacillus cereus]MDM5191493.1 DUF5819 family protein [Bacillus hominis]MDM5441919.1 DUF5819 family protein [Bacillus hominis]